MTRKSPLQNFDRAIAYIRVSTSKQGIKRFGLQGQRVAIEAYADTKGISIIEWFEEVASAAGNNNVERRPALEDAIGLAKTLGVPLLVWDVSRLTRSERSALQLMKDPAFVLISASEDIPKDPASLAAIAARAEYHQNTISETTKKGLVRARARGKVLGNTRNLEEARRRGVARNVAKKDEVVAQIADALETLDTKAPHTARQIADLLNRRGLRTRTGREWTISALRRPLRSAHELLLERKKLSRHPLFGRF